MFIYRSKCNINLPCIFRGKKKVFMNRSNVHVDLWIIKSRFHMNVAWKAQPSSTFRFWISSLWSMKSGDLLQAFSDQPKYVFSFWKQVLISKLHWNSSIWQFYSAIYLFLSFFTINAASLPQYQCKSGPRNIILYPAIPHNQVRVRQGNLTKRTELFFIIPVVYSTQLV